MIAFEEYLTRQKHLLSQCKPNSICIVGAASLQTRSNDTEYLFRQNSNFWYLTGFDEPQAWLLLSNHEDFGFEYRVMFVQKKNSAEEIWHGRRLGVEQAKKRFCLDDAFCSEEINTVLPELLNKHLHVYFALGDNSQQDEILQKALTHLRKQSRKYSEPAAIYDIRPLIHQQRLIKSPSELKLMKKAADISVSAHKRAMQHVHAGCYEYQLEAEILHEFAMNGARTAAYSTIVGAGDNACILHYTENASGVESTDLVLIDAGAEYQGYAADITRTFPVSGKFNDAQKAIYELVLQAQQAVLDEIKVGMTFPEAHHISVEVITQGLISLGILSGTLAHNLELKTWRTFYMHGVGHYLGLDVHDVGDYGTQDNPKPFAEGMVITIEPGIYIAKDNTSVAPCYRGIGVRIEDNVLFTHEGIEVLTAKAPKTVEEIEGLMEGNSLD